MPCGSGSGKVVGKGGRRDELGGRDDERPGLDRDVPHRRLPSVRGVGRRRDPDLRAAAVDHGAGERHPVLPADETADPTDGRVDHDRGRRRLRSRETGARDGSASACGVGRGHRPARERAASCRAFPGRFASRSLTPIAQTTSWRRHASTSSSTSGPGTSTELSPHPLPELVEPTRPVHPGCGGGPGVRRVERDECLRQHSEPGARRSDVGEQADSLRDRRLGIEDHGRRLDGGHTDGRKRGHALLPDDSRSKPCTLPCRRRDQERRSIELTTRPYVPVRTSSGTALPRSPSDGGRRLSHSDVRRPEPGQQLRQMLDRRLGSLPRVRAEQELGLAFRGIPCGSDPRDGVEVPQDRLAKRRIRVCGACLRAGYVLRPGCCSDERARLRVGCRKRPDRAERTAQRGDQDREGRGDAPVLDQGRIVAAPVSRVKLPGVEMVRDASEWKHAGAGEHCRLISEPWRALALGAAAMKVGAADVERGSKTVPDREAQNKETATAFYDLMFNQSKPPSSTSVRSTTTSSRTSS